MAKYRTKKERYSKKTVTYTEALRERLLLFSDKSPKVNKRDKQILGYESSIKYVRLK